ncbi:MAG TPA: tetratricopeptide repeat protein [Candidatus Competibacter sp.]|nr:tetratricopeptide repeat protein [Candidatus Competibacter sp.]
MNRTILAILGCAALSGCASMEHWAMPPALSSAPQASGPATAVDLPAPAPAPASVPIPGSIPAAPLSSPPPPPLTGPVPPAPALSSPASVPPSAPAPAAPTVGAGVSNPAFIEERAHHAYETGRLDVAEGYYLQLVRLKPKDSGPWFQLGNLYSEQGRLDAAERAYRESLRRRDDARTLHNLGLAQVKLGIGALREAQKRLPPNDPARRETQEFLRILLESVGK